MKTYTYEQKVSYLNSGEFYTWAWDGKYHHEDSYEEHVFADAFVDELPNEQTLFHIGMDTKPVKTCICKRCGGNKFHVGGASWCTAIKCVTCQWEVVVHEG